MLCENNSLYCSEITDYSGLGTEILGASNLMSEQREGINIPASLLINYLFYWEQGIKHFQDLLYYFR